MQRIRTIVAQTVCKSLVGNRVSMSRIKCIHEKQYKQEYKKSVCETHIQKNIYIRTHTRHIHLQFLSPSPSISLSFCIYICIHTYTNGKEAVDTIRPNQTKAGQSPTDIWMYTDTYTHLRCCVRRNHAAKWTHESSLMSQHFKMVYLNYIMQNWQAMSCKGLQTLHRDFTERSRYRSAGQQMYVHIQIFHDG